MYVQFVEDNSAPVTQHPLPFEIVPAPGDEVEIDGAVYSILDRPCRWRRCKLLPGLSERFIAVVKVARP